MSFNWGPVAGGALDLLGGGIGGFFSYKGVKETNIANAKMAQQQMDFQERMSNTAYQRSMADMKKAGLNPILAFSKGGADAPSGAMAQMQNALGSGVSTAMQAVRLREDLRALQLQNDIVKASLPKARAEERFWNSWLGKSMPFITGGSSALQSLMMPFVPLLNEGKSVWRAFNALNLMKR